MPLFDHTNFSKLPYPAAQGGPHLVTDDARHIEENDRHGFVVEVFQPCHANTANAVAQRTLFGANVQ